MLGYWYKDDKGLPYFEYVGKIPYHQTLGNGKKVKLPEDPWFILGNYQLTVFPHVSGEYELITGQRAWGRMNAADRFNGGNNDTVISYRRKKEKTVSLVGMDSLSADNDICKKTFGCGFAQYRYVFDDLEIVKNLSVKPSTNPYNGSSAMMVTVKIKNNGEKAVFHYKEKLSANYAQISFQNMPESERPVHFKYTEKTNGDCGVIDISKIDDDPLLVENKNTATRIEGFPPSLFIKTLTQDNITVDKRTIAVDNEFELEKNDEKTIQMLVGFTFKEGVTDIDTVIKDMCSHDRIQNNQSLYSDEWRKIIPSFEDEKDEIFKREMQWNTYVLEAMATYSSYYKETKIPQGTIYDYGWGQHLSARDNFQHAMPLVYYNPALAHSVLKYMLKRTTTYGEIRLAEFGNGYSDNLYYSTSDQQLFFFQFLEAYLRVTKDYSVLLEDVTPYPASSQCNSMKVYELVKNCFIYLRDSIGLGEHGLVRLLNSDWNDTLFYIVKEPYNRVYFSGESHMNSAMVLSVFQNLIPQLYKSKTVFSDKSVIDRLCQSMSVYRKKVLSAFDKEMEGRIFSKRMYFAGKAYGEENMFLEPQCFVLQINEYSRKFRIKLYQEMKERLYKGESIGAREQELPEFEDPEFDKGSRENGGIWWALNAPVITAMKDLDITEAWKLLKNMTFDHISKCFPEYWTSYWSFADNMESSLIIEEGLPDQSANYSDEPVFCAHAHAWPLYCYYYLKGTE